MDVRAASLVSSNVGALPLVRRIMDRLGIDSLLDQEIVRRRLGRKAKLGDAKVLSIMVTNVLMSRMPLYAVPEWAAGFRSELFGQGFFDPKTLNDDRIGRALDRLFELERSSTLMTAIVTRAVREFDIDLTQIHNDTTTVTFAGDYAGQAAGTHPAQPPLITFGHNKDHRPDLKQLVYSLTISADGAIPVHYRSYSGNTTDDRTHLETWTIVRSIRGTSDFLYVADSKLCTRENMAFIDEQGGRFLTVLPRTRREHEDFRNYIATERIPWVEVSRKKSPRGDRLPEEVYKAAELDVVTAEGYRIIWYSSSVKRENDENRRHKKIVRARQRLEQLADRRGAHALRTLERAQLAADRILEQEGAKRWLDVFFTEEPIAEMRQATPGRPGPTTRYRRITKGNRIVFHISENVPAIQEDARVDGIFAMVTNDRKATPTELLRAYKYQPFLEKRHEQLKSVLSVAPIFLKNAERVASLLFLYFIAVLVFALMEREVRREMKKRGVAALPLYPEERDCTDPTADGIMRSVEAARRHELIDEKGQVARVFHDPISEVAVKIIDMLGVNKSNYGL